MIKDDSPFDLLFPMGPNHIHIITNDLKSREPHTWIFPKSAKLHFTIDQIRSDFQLEKNKESPEDEWMTCGADVTLR